MNPKDPKVILGAIVAVLIVGFLLSRGSSGSTVTSGGVDPQKAFQNALQLQAQDQAQKSTYVNALLQYSKSAQDYALGANTLTASTGLEQARIQNAYLLGGRELDLQGRALDSQTQVSLAGLSSAERIAQDQNKTQIQMNNVSNETQRQNGILGFFGNLFGGIIGLFA